MENKSFKPINWLSNLVWKIKPKGIFEGSKEFWNKRYKSQGTSGPGSYGRLALFKSEIVNDFLKHHEVKSVIDFGCGDGNQIRDIQFSEYIGFDVSENTIKKCRKLYEDKKNYLFKVTDEYNGEEADLVISLDVIFHLVENRVYQKYMERLFNASRRYIIIYSSNFEQISLNPFKPYKQVRHRKFTDWISKNQNDWKLYRFIENPYMKKTGDSSKNHSHSNFYIYKKEG